MLQHTFSPNNKAGQTLPLKEHINTNSNIFTGTWNSFKQEGGCLKLSTGVDTTVFTDTSCRLCLNDPSERWPDLLILLELNVRRSLLHTQYTYNLFGPLCPIVWFYKCMNIVEPKTLVFVLIRSVFCIFCDSGEHRGYSVSTTVDRFIIILYILEGLICVQ